MRDLVLLLTSVFTLSLTGCGYNAFQTGEERIKASWPRWSIKYQRRADPIPDSVGTVKGYAAQESEVLVGVSNARAKASGVQATPELVDNPNAFAKFQAAQGDLAGALSRLLLDSENYPQLKSDATLRDLQGPLERTEKRIAVARNDYIKAVQTYIVNVRSFPSNLTAMAFGFKTKPNFTVENEKAIANPAKVDFGKTPAKSPGEAVGVPK